MDKYHTTLDLLYYHKFRDSGVFGVMQDFAQYKYNYGSAQAIAGLPTNFLSFLRGSLCLVGYTVDRADQILHHPRSSNWVLQSLQAVQI